MYIMYTYKLCKFEPLVDLRSSADWQIFSQPILYSGGFPAGDVLRVVGRTPGYAGQRVDDKAHQYPVD